MIFRVVKPMPPAYHGACATSARCMIRRHDGKPMPAAFLSRCRATLNRRTISVGVVASQCIVRGSGASAARGEQDCRMRAQVACGVLVDAGVYSA